MKVCRIVDDFPVRKEIREGFAPNWYYYSKLSAEKGIEVHVICGGAPEQLPEEEIEGINVHRVSLVKGYRSALYGDFAKNCIKKIEEIKPDIIHGHNASHISVVRNRRKIEIPLITHLHGSIDQDMCTEKLPFSFDFKRALRDRIIALASFLRYRYTATHADLIIACDKYTLNSVRKHIGSVEARVVYNGVDLNLFKKTKSKLKEELEADHLLLYIGRPVPWKGVQYLLRAVDRLNRQYKGLKCLLVGVKRDDKRHPNYIYYRWLKSIADELRLRNVIFSPPTAYFDLPKYYSGVDCFVTPSYPDSSPKTVYEAQACSCPVVAANGGGIPEIFSENSGLLFKPRDVEDLVRKIKTVLENPEKFRGGREVVKEKATWKKCVEDIIECYEFLLHN